MVVIQSASSHLYVAISGFLQRVGHAVRDVLLAFPLALLVICKVYACCLVDKKDYCEEG